MIGSIGPMLRNGSETIKEKYGVNPGTSQE
jgi:hypothetical protein